MRGRFLLILLLICSSIFAQAETEVGETDEGFVMRYPQSMHDKGFNDLVLHEEPERVAVLLTKPVRTLHMLGVNLVAIPTAGSLPWPGDIDCQQFVIPYDREFDLEQILILSPDLIVLGDNQQERYGELCDSLGVPVYYVDNTSGFTYGAVEAEVMALANAFDHEGVKTAEIGARFDEYKENADRIASVIDGETVLVLQHQGSRWNYQSRIGTVGMTLDMFGFENISDDTFGTGPFSYESVLGKNPDLVVFVGSTGNPQQDTLIVEKELKNNHIFWDSFDAIKNGKYIILDRQYSVIHGVSVFEQHDGIFEALRNIGYDI